MLTSTRLEKMIISTRSLTKPLDFHFRNKPSLPIPSSQILCDTSKLHRWPQLGHHGLISPMVRAHDGRVSAPSSMGGEKGNGERSTRIISSMQAIIGVSFALACVLAIFCSGSTLSMLSPRKAMATTPRIHTAIPSQTKAERNVISPISGQLALSLFMDAVVYLGSSRFNYLPPAKIYRQDVAKF
ncbi:hypothetical protein TIFTF001_012465 [Ficus carica]|uniref:Uncharacterized protein n=1 Tax=Ficus carica TaxID=3494 RepID=A0AA88A1R9_FICCA|nr:hypothetical protein TIFTF001_012465 [Ficus carica]